MAKKIIQDVLVNNKRSIRQISVSRVRRPMRNEGAIKIEKEEFKEYETALRPEKREKIKKRNIPKIAIWIIAILSVIILLFAVTSFFSTATVTVVPKIASVSLDDVYVARKDALPGELQYEVMTLRRKMSKELKATETENSQIKASGKIIIYNNFSAASQRLIINTRFESEKGLIYKIPESITVPGIKIIGGKKVPGSIETAIFADEPGAKYNIKISNSKEDFKIPGFKGDKKYDYFYAKLKTDIVGGTSGVVKKVPAKILTEARDELRENIKSELVKEAYANKPQSSILTDGAYYVDYVSLPDSFPGEDKVEISEEATLRGIIFDEAKLSSYVAKKELSDYDESPVHLVLSDDVSISISNNSKVKLWEGDTVNLSIKGGADIVWVYDKEILKKSLAGYKKSEIDKFLLSYPGIKEIIVQLRPVWKRTFPSDPKKIKIIDFESKK